MMGGMSSVYDQAAQAFKSGERLYIDEAALTEFEDDGTEIDEGAQNAAREALDTASIPIFLAVLPESARNGSANDLGASPDIDGTYVAMLAPDAAMDAASSTMPLGNARQVARDARDGSNGDLGVICRTTGRGARGGRRRGIGRVWGWVFRGGSGGIPLGIIAAVGGGGFLLYRRNKRNKERADLEPVRAALDEDVTAYGEELAELDLDLLTPRGSPRGGSAGVRAGSRSL